jgi:hypothetical protein
MIFMMIYLKTRNALNKLSIFKIFLFSVFITFIATACQKPEDLGDDVVVLPGEKLNVAFTDTVTVQAHSYMVDSIATKSVSVQLLGGIYNPVFGSTATGLFTQVRLANNDLDFGANPVCDSIIFGLDYASFYGDTNAIQHITIYELDEDMYTDSAYYSNQKLAVKSTPLFDEDLVFKPSDSIQLVGGKVKPHLRMRLPNSFGDYILSKSSQTELSNNEEFLKFIKGFFVMASEKTSGGGLAYVNLLGNYSRMTLYYHNDEDTTYEHFLINTNCAYYSYFDHFDYYNASAEFRNQVIQKDSSLGNQVLYLQPLSGVRVKIRFPYLKQLIHLNPLAIQQADIIFNVSGLLDTADYPTPAYFSLVGVTDEGNQVYLTDYSEGSSYFGGYYDASKNQYVFTITHTIQEMLLGTNNIKELDLIVSGEAVQAKGAVLNGSGAGLSNRTRLKLYYTDVNLK